MNVLSRAISSELPDGLRSWPVWTLLGWNDIRQRYRLRPWTVLDYDQHGVFTLMLGVIYSQLFHMDIKTYLP